MTESELDKVLSNKVWGSKNYKPKNLVDGYIIHVHKDGEEEIVGNPDGHLWAIMGDDAYDALILGTGMPPPPTIE